MTHIELHDDGAGRNLWFGKIAICVRINEMNRVSNSARLRVRLAVWRFRPIAISRQRAELPAGRSI
jgi:hypothetical protein